MTSWLSRLLNLAAAGRNLALAVVDLFRSKRNAAETEGRLERSREREAIEDEIATQSDDERNRTAGRFVRNRPGADGRR